MSTVGEFVDTRKEKISTHARRGRGISEIFVIRLVLGRHAVLTWAVLAACLESRVMYVLILTTCPNLHLGEAGLTGTFNFQQQTPSVGNPYVLFILLITASVKRVCLLEFSRRI